MPIKVALDRLTIAQAEKVEGSSIFVLNKSNPKGNVNFVVTDMAQQKISVQVPVTFVPVDLSMFATKEDVLRNPNFRRLIARNFLHIVTSESAEEFLADPSATKEHNRIFDVLQDDSSSLEASFNAPVSESVNATAPEAEGEVSQFVQNILLRAAAENIDDLIVELEGKLDTMSPEDVTYLLNNTSDAGLKTWCGEALEVING